MTNLIFKFLIIFSKVTLADTVTVGPPSTTASSTTSATDYVTISPDVIVNNVYQISLMGAGILAFGVIIFAALRYTLAAGNPSIQSDAKDQITQAILGLVLLLSAYLILNTINPRLTNLSLPTITTLNPTPDNFDTLGTPVYVRCVSKSSPGEKGTCYVGGMACVQACNTSTSKCVLDEQDRKCP